MAGAGLMASSLLFDPHEVIVDKDGRPSWTFRPKWERLAKERVSSAVGSVVTANYKVKAGDSIIPVDATAGVVTVTLPATPSGQYTIKKIDASANAVTVSGTIDGAASYALSSQYDSVTVAGGTEWHVI